MKYKEALTKELLGELSSQGTLLNVPKNTQIVSIGDPVKDIPFLVSGKIRVYIESYETGKEVLLYYLENGETCFMSVIAGLGDEISKVSAVTESDCVINAVPNEMVKSGRGSTRFGIVSSSTCWFRITQIRYKRSRSCLF